MSQVSGKEIAFVGWLHSRAARAAMGFFFALSAYWLYVLLVVPCVEPTGDSSHYGTASTLDLWRVDQQFRKRRQRLRQLFPSGAWELRNPKILESRSVVLLFQEYATHKGNTLVIWPCTLIFLPGGYGLETNEGLARAVVLQAEAAQITFDRQVDLNRAQIGKPQTGLLQGKVVVRSKGDPQKSEDDFLLQARNLHFDRGTIWSDDQVNFRFGPHYGSATGLTIALGESEKDKPARDLPAVQLIKFDQLTRLHLELEPKGTLRRFVARHVEKRSKQPPQKLPLDIRCGGTCTIDVPRLTVRFEDGVTIEHRRFADPSDVVQADTVTLAFATAEQAHNKKERLELQSKDHTTAGQSLSRFGQGILAGDFFAKLEPVYMALQGDPFIVRAPTLGSYVQGAELTYDLQSGWLIVSGNDSFLRYGENLLVGGRIEYQVDQRSVIGQARITGPGRVRLEVENGPGRIEAAWDGQLLLRQHEGQKVLSVLQNVHLVTQAGHAVAADEVHCWLQELGKEKKPPIFPDRVLASGNVRFKFGSLTGHVKQMRFWFERDTGKQPATTNLTVPATLHLASTWRCQPVGPVWIKACPRRQLGLSYVFDRRSVPPAYRLCSFRQVTLAAPAPEAAGMRRSSIASAPFDIAAEEVDGRIKLAAGRLRMDELLVRGNVQVREIQEPAARYPFLLAGELLHVKRAGTPSMSVALLGEPAHVEGRGLGLTGNQINLDLASNRLWIDGPGKADIVLQQGPQEKHNVTGDLLQIRWTRRMLFDGKTVHLEGQLDAKMEAHTLATDVMTITLRNRLEFAQLGSRADLEIAEIHCSQTVSLESRVYSLADQLQELRQLRLRSLMWQVADDTLVGEGPGWVRVVRRVTDFDASSLITGPFASSREGGGTNSDRLETLMVRFQGDITGSVSAQRLHVENQVRAVYGPVQSWTEWLDPDQINSPGEDLILLACDRLDASVVPTGTGKQSWELVASGNVSAESSQYFCRAARASFAVGKGLLVVEGQGHGPAEFFRQTKPGEPFSRIAAARILYWPATGKLVVEGPQSLQLQ